MLSALAFRRSLGTQATRHHSPFYWIRREEGHQCCYRISLPGTSSLRSGVCLLVCPDQVSLPIPVTLFVMWHRWRHQASAGCSVPFRHYGL